MKGIVLYAVISVTLVALVGWLLTLGFRAPGDAAAIRLSAIVALVVQLVAFAALRLVGPQRRIVGWGVGSLLRLVTLVVYGLLVAKVLVGIPVTPALLALVTFFFLSTLVEPLLLKS